MTDAWGFSDLIDMVRKMECNSQTIRYAISVTGLTALGLTSIIVDGDIGNVMAVAVAGAIGYLAKDWRSKPVILEVVDDAEEV